jgi:uncharacterized protein (DUF58 family)
MGMIRKSLSAQINRWIDRRLPRSDSQSFGQKNVFILPTGAGMVFGLLLVVMLITAINYQNSLIYLLVFLLGALFVGAMHQTHRNLSGLTLSMIVAGEGEAGGDVPFRFRIASGRNDSLAMMLSTETARLDGIHVPAGEARDVSLAIPATRRGYLRPDRIRIETRFPFGLLKAWSWLRPASAGVVFPRSLQAPEVGSTVEDPNESASAARIAGQDVADLRPWREGDMSPRVMWKRYARSGQMVVADWEAQGGSPHWLDYSAFPGADTELRLSYLAWLVRDRAARGARFGLSLPGETIEPDSGNHHAQRCLRALAVWGLEKPRDADSRTHGTRSDIDQPVSGSMA